MKSGVGRFKEQKGMDPNSRFLGVLRVFATVVFLFLFYRLRGLSAEREQIIGVILLSLLLLTAGRDIRKILTAFANWLPFVVLMVLYDFTRGAADELGMPIQVQLPLVADRWVCGCYATPVLREWIPVTPRTGYPTAYWYEVVFSVTYATHFFLPYLTAAVLWLKSEKRFHRFRDTFFLLTFAGLVIYVLVPTTPPWLAGEQGLIPGIDESSRTSGNGWRVLSITWAESLLNKGRAVSNPVAALPSLHAAYSLFFSLMIWPQARWFRRGIPGVSSKAQEASQIAKWFGSKLWWPGTRIILFLFPLVMLVTLVIAAEHYLFDVFLGWIFAIAVVSVFNEKRYQRLRTWAKALLKDRLGFLSKAKTPDEVPNTLNP